MPSDSVKLKARILDQNYALSSDEISALQDYIGDMNLYADVLAFRNNPHNSELIGLIGASGLSGEIEFGAGLTFESYSNIDPTKNLMKIKTKAAWHHERFSVGLPVTYADWFAAIVHEGKHLDPNVASIKKNTNDAIEYKRSHYENEAIAELATLRAHLIVDPNAPYYNVFSKGGRINLLTLDIWTPGAPHDALGISESKFKKAMYTQVFPLSQEDIDANNDFIHQKNQQKVPQKHPDPLLDGIKNLLNIKGELTLPQQQYLDRSTNRDLREAVDSDGALSSPLAGAGTAGSRRLWSQLQGIGGSVQSGSPLDHVLTGEPLVIRKPDGTTQIFTENAVITERANGTVTGIFADGRAIESFADGQVIYTDSFGRVIFSKNNNPNSDFYDAPVLTVNPDGSYSATYPDGSHVESASDGTTTIYDSDGKSILSENPNYRPIDPITINHLTDGSSTTLYSDGSRLVTLANGDTIFYGPDGREERSERTSVKLLKRPQNASPVISTIFSYGLLQALLIAPLLPEPLPIPANPEPNGLPESQGYTNTNNQLQGLFSTALDSPNYDPILIDLDEVPSRGV